MEKPTVEGLVENLKDLVRGWKTFAIHLPEIEQPDIDTIESDRRDDTVDQKQRLYDKWLRAYPEASWEDVIVALEKAKENKIAKSLREKFHITETAMSPKQPEGLQELPEISSETCDPVPVPDEVVEELNNLHSNFLSLTEIVREGIKRKTTRSPDCLDKFVQRVKDIKSFTIDFPSSVNDTDQFFEAIRPHYNFLDPFIVVHLAQKLGGSIARKAKLYSCQTEDFMKRTEIKDLHNDLKPYCGNFGSSKAVIRVEISVQNAMGTQSVFLVKQLVRTLFFLKSSDTLLWLKVVRGCLCVVLLAPVQMKIGLIESSRKKLQFMRLTGIIRLLIDDLPVLAEEEDEHFSFERNLKQARVDNNTEAVQVLQEFVRQSPLKGFGNSEVKLDCSNKEEKVVEVVKKQITHLKDDEHSTQESESPDFVKLQDELEMWKKQSNCKDTELQRQKEQIQALSKDLFYKETKLSMKVSELNDVHEHMNKMEEQVQDLERRLYISDDMLSKTKAELNEHIERYETVKPTVADLCKELTKLVDWEKTVIQLPAMRSDEVEKVKKDERTVDQRKQKAFHIWLNKCPEASWLHVTEALEKAEENTLKEEIAKKHGLSLVSSEEPTTPHRKF